MREEEEEEVRLSEAQGSMRWSPNSPYILELLNRLFRPDFEVVVHLVPPGPKDSLDHFPVAVAPGLVNRLPPKLALGIDRGAMIQENLDALLPAKHDGDNLEKKRKRMKNVALEFRYWWTIKEIQTTEKRREARARRKRGEARVVGVVVVVAAAAAGEREKEKREKRKRRNRNQNSEKD